MTPTEKHTPAERLAALELDNAAIKTRIESLATVASVTALTAAVNAWQDSNTRQHQEMKALLNERAFSDAPNSLQGRLNAIDERAFGDSPTSLRSQIIEIQQRNKWANGWVVGALAALSFVGNFLVFKWAEVVRWFESLGSSNVGK